MTDIGERVARLEVQEVNNTQKIADLCDQVKDIHEYVQAQKTLTAYRKPWIGFAAKLITPLGCGALGGIATRLLG